MPNRRPCECGRGSIASGNIHGGVGVSLVASRDDILLAVNDSIQMPSSRVGSVDNGRSTTVVEGPLCHCCDRRMPKLVRH